MAINENINPYLVGNVVLDNRPYLQFYQQQLAQRQAKETALDNYFRDLGKNVTPAGMRSQDVEGLTNKTNEWRQFYSQNKDAISNPRIDGGKAYTEYMARYQDQLAHIEQSKRALKTTDELNKTRLNPQSSYILDDPGIVEKIQVHDLPLGDPRRQDLDIATLAVPPKPWSIKDKEAYSKYLTSGLQYNETPGKTEYLPNFQTRTPITKEYSDENLRVIGQRAMSAYDTDRALQFQTNKLTKDVMNDEVLHNKLNASFRRVYGKDIESPKELLAAQAIVEENRKSIEFKMGDDDFGRQKALEFIRFGHQKQLKKEDQKVADDWIINYWNQRFADAKSGEPSPLPGPKTPTLTYKMGYQLNPDQVMMEALKKGGVYPDDVFVTGNNKILPVFYKYRDVLGESGKKIGTEVDIDENGNAKVDESYTKPIELDQAYLSMGYKGQTKKDLGGTMSGVYGGNKTEAKPKRVIQGGHEYILNDKTGEYE